MKRLLGAPSVWLCLVFLATALVGPWLVGSSPEAIDLAHAYELPSAQHWLGTADNGVDLLSALTHGARLAGIIGLSVASLAHCSARGFTSPRWRSMIAARSDSQRLPSFSTVAPPAHL